MTSPLKQFLETVKTARNERTAEAAALLQNLKGMTPEQFVRLPRAMLQDLTNDQYASVVKHIVPGHKLPQPTTKQSKRASRLRDLCKAMPSWMQAAVAALLAGLPMMALALLVVPAMHWWQYQWPPVRPIETSTWPHCLRLNEWVDGCTYVPIGSMTWERAAGLLAIAEPELRQTNRHIRENYIPAGATIAIWRHRGILLGGTP